MALSYAGVSLPLTTPQHQEWLKQVHPQRFQDWSAWNFQGYGLDSLPTPAYPSQPKFQFGVLHWPTGAVRPAWFHCVVTTEKLNEIREAIGECVMTPQILAMDDGRDGHQIFASMYMLPARPLNLLGVNDAEDAWVLTLTDARFYWGQWKRGTITVEDGVTTWNDLYSQLSTIIGTTITPDTIPDEFSTPTTKWNSYAEPSATILDAVATQIGQRVVVQLDGTVSTVNWATAKGSSDAQIDNQTVISGGLVSATDISRYIPAYVGVLFPQEGETAPFSRTRSLAAADVSGLAPCNGLADASGWVYADFVYDGSNIADVNDWADAASNAWFGWQFDDTDVVFPGIQNWFPTGWESYIEWTYQKREGQPFASTYVVRGPWDDFAAGGWQTSSSNGGVSLCGSVDTGWAAGLLDTECLFMTVLKADGLCSNIDITQEGYMRWKESDSKWVFQEWDCELEQWVDKNFIVDTIEAPLKFWIDDASGDARLEIAGITRKLMWVCSGDGTIVFSGGTELMCGGVSPPAAVQCDNNFLVKLQCVCCPIDGWQGRGYYCIVNEGEDCETDTKQAVLLTNPCTEGIVICSCKYDTLEEAEAQCPTQEFVDCNGEVFPKYVAITIVPQDYTIGDSCPNPVSPTTVIGTWSDIGTFGWDFSASGTDWYVIGKIIADCTTWQTGTCGGSPVGSPTFGGAANCGALSVVYSCGLYNNQRTDFVNYAAKTCTITLTTGHQLNVAPI